MQTVAGGLRLLPPALLTVTHWTASPSWAHTAQGPLEGWPVCCRDADQGWGAGRSPPRHRQATGLGRDPLPPPSAPRRGGTRPAGEPGGRLETLGEARPKKTTPLPRSPFPSHPRLITGNLSAGVIRKKSERPRMTCLVGGATRSSSGCGGSADPESGSCHGRQPQQPL